MAFSASEMVLMAQGNNHKLYFYMTTDTAAGRRRLGRCRLSE